MSISAEQVKELRDATGVGIVDCKQALEETEGDLEAAIAWLRRKGKMSAAKKASRQTHEGVIVSYVHSNHKVAVLVALQCETDFVARTPQFQELARNIALHIAAADPIVIRAEDVPAAEVAKEEAVAREQAAASGKPQAIVDKMIAGKLEKFRAERALLTQPYVKDPKRTIAELIAEAVGTIGENITVGQFSRLSI